MPDVVVVGSVNMDTVVRLERLPKPGETLHGLGIYKYPGGKGSNQATALARLGNTVKFAGMVGSDEDGRTLKTKLAQEGVNVQSLRFSESSHTGVAIIVVDKNGNNEIIVIQGANNEVNQEFFANQDGLFVGAKFLLMQFEIPIDTVSYLAALAKRNQMQVVINPSPFYPMEKQLLGVIDFLVLNEQEAGLLIERKIQTIDQAFEAVREIKKLGPGCVVLTMGDQGAVTCNQVGDIDHVAAFSITPVDTTASGDAFLGGLLHGLLAGNTLRQSVVFANAVGAMTASKMGAQSSLPNIGEVETFLSSRSIQKK